MKLSITIESGNAAVTEDGAEHELARLVEGVAESIRSGADGGFLRDYNGNNVGRWTYDRA